MRILGVDPGSRFTGYGCIEAEGRNLTHLGSGTLRVATEGREKDFPARLVELYRALSEVIGKYAPQIMVVERIFFAKNAMSALKLGQARGVVLFTGAQNHLEIAEYTPAEVKQAIGGHGRADKLQIAQMVQLLLGQKKSQMTFETHDASDALSLALCHAQITHSLRNRVARSALTPVKRTDILEP